MVVDATYLEVEALRAFIREEMADAKAQGILSRFTLKATMMKVSDPVIFGHVLSVFLEPVFAKHADTFRKLGVNPNAGLAELDAKFAALAAADQAPLRADIAACLQERPALYMVNSDKGVSNLHVPNDVIIDASMPAPDPRRRQSLGTGRSRRRCQLRDPRQHLCGHL